MRILIQSRDTGFFYKDPDSWTRESVEAFDFKSTLTAFEAHQQKHLKRVRIVLKFTNDKMDIELPLQDDDK